MKSVIFQKFLYYTVITCSLLTFCYALAVFFGKQLPHPIFKQVEATEHRMIYDTALCFCFSSAALLATFYDKQKLGIIFTIVVIALSVISFIQMTLNYNITINHAIVEPLGKLDELNNIKMHPFTPFCFLLTSLAILQLGRSNINSVYIVTQTVMILILSFLFLFGYTWRIETTQFIHSSITLMETNSAVGFVILSLGIIAAAFYLKPYNSKQAERMVPIVIALFIGGMSLISFRVITTTAYLSNLTNQLPFLSTIKELFLATLIGMLIYFFQKNYINSRYFKVLYAMTKSTLEAAHNGILVVNSQKRVVEFNEKFLNLWGLNSSDIEQKNEQYIFERISKAVSNSKEIEAIAKDLHLYPEKSTGCVLKLSNGKIVEFYSQPQRYLKENIGQVYSFEDITHLKAAEEKLIHNATHDNLTGLANRILVYEHIEKEIARVQRLSGIFAILFLDLDAFKVVNDTLGHMVGDKVLRKVAKKLLFHTRSEDTLARVGGDEFILLAVDLKSKAEAAIIANKYLQVLSTPFWIDENKINIKCSIGISAYPGDGANAIQLVQNADIAMYIAKKEKNHIQFYDETMQNEITDRVSLENELLQALDKKQLELFYQPIIDLRTKRICGTEALIRWNHPTRGLLAPSEFIHAAEENGSIEAIGKWVVEQACMQNKQWHDSKLLSQVISVNISSKQLEKITFVNEVASILTRTELDPQFLQLELTENRLIENLESFSQVLSNLKMLGIKIAIDDFGTGYTGLSFIRQFPIDKIKIDKSLIQNIPGNSIEEAIISAMVKLCDTLGMTICIEGIETEDQLKHLLSLGCKEGQGFLFAHPLEVKKYNEIINNFEMNDYN